MKHFYQAVENYNTDFLARCKEEERKNIKLPIPFKKNMPLDVVKNTIMNFKFNMVFIITGEGVSYNNALAKNTLRFLETCNEILLDGESPERLYHDLDISKELYNEFWKGTLPVQDIHWKGLITEHNVSPMYAFMDSPIKYIKL